MADVEASELVERAVNIAMMCLTYVGVYMEDPDEGTALMAQDSTLEEMMTSDVQLGVMMALTWVASAADLDATDVRTIAQSIIDGMIASGQ